MLCEWHLLIQWSWWNRPVAVSGCLTLYSLQVNIFLLNKKTYNSVNLQKLFFLIQNLFKKKVFLNVLFRLGVWWLTGKLTEPSKGVAGIDLPLYLDTSLSTSTGRYFLSLDKEVFNNFSLQKLLLIQNLLLFYFSLMCYSLLHKIDNLFL